MLGTYLRPQGGRSGMRDGGLLVVAVGGEGVSILAVAVDALHSVCIIVTLHLTLNPSTLPSKQVHALSKGSHNESKYVIF